MILKKYTMNDTINNTIYEYDDMIRKMILNFRPINDTLEREDIEWGILVVCKFVVVVIYS